MLRVPAARLTFALPKPRQFVSRFCCLYRLLDGLETDDGPCYFSLEPNSQKGGRESFLISRQGRRGFCCCYLSGWSVCLAVRLSVCLTSIADID